MRYVTNSSVSEVIDIVNHELGTKTNSRVDELLAQYIMTLWHIRPLNERRETFAIAEWGKTLRAFRQNLVNCLLREDHGWAWIDVQSVLVQLRLMMSSEPGGGSR